jgi:hypothetical protein
MYTLIRASLIYMQGMDLKRTSLKLPNNAADIAYCVEDANLVSLCGDYLLAGITSCMRTDSSVHQSLTMDTMHGLGSFVQKLLMPRRHPAACVGRFRRELWQGSQLFQQALKRSQCSRVNCSA